MITNQDMDPETAAAPLWPGFSRALSLNSRPSLNSRSRSAHHLLWLTILRDERPLTLLQVLHQTCRFPQCHCSPRCPRGAHPIALPTAPCRVAKVQFSSVQFRDHFSGTRTRTYYLKGELNQNQNRTCQNWFY